MCNRTNKVVFIILAITAIAWLVFLSIVEMTRIALQIIAAQRSARKRRHQHQAAPIAAPSSSPSAGQTSPIALEPLQGVEGRVAARGGRVDIINPIGPLFPG